MVVPVRLKLRAPKEYKNQVGFEPTGCASTLTSNNEKELVMKNILKGIAVLAALKMLFLASHGYKKCCRCGGKCSMCGGLKCCNGEAEETSSDEPKTTIGGLGE
jgi:hypothetical protein